MARRPPLLLRLGLAQLLRAILLGCVLLVANSVLLASLYNARAGSLPEFWRNARVAQAVLFLGPVALLAIQWWAFDILMDWVYPIDLVWGKRKRKGR